MPEHDPQKEWRAYCERELALLRPLLSARGFTLAEDQPHLAGERYLMQAITTESGRKLILLGTRTKDTLQVVIKATSDRGGVRELVHERRCRTMLHTINFAYDVFHSPEEIAFFTERGMCVSIQRFIPQERAFLERPIEEQCTFALRSFKAQESAHATTHTHLRAIQKIFATYTADTYLRVFNTFVQNVREHFSDATALHETLIHAQDVFSSAHTRIEQYCGFLTHTDFVPHNFRIQGNTLYLLDFSSLRFGNKYEGWARFVNFMTLYNPALETALVQYVHDTRAPEEGEALMLMRIYRLGEIIWYYVRAYEQSTGDLHTLNCARIDLWHTVLRATLAGTYLSEHDRNAYITTRDRLRSAEEKRRQIGLH